MLPSSLLPPALPDSWPPLARLLLLVGVFLLGYLLGIALAGGVIAVVWGVPLNGLSALLSGNAFHPAQSRILLVVQGLSHLVGFTVAPLILLAFTLPARPFGQWLRAQGRVSAKWLAAGVGLTLVSVPLISAAIDWNASLHLGSWFGDLDAWMRAKEETGKRLTELLTRMHSLPDLVVGVLVIGLLPAVGEELLFRGVMQPTLTRWVGHRPHLGIWLTAIIFSAIHMQFLGFVPRLLLGAGFGYLYQWSGRLAVPMAAHFTNNALQVVMLYLSQRGALPGFDPDATDSLPWPWVVASAAATTALLVGLHWGRRQPITQSVAQPLATDA